jgi:hypothetical protein
MTKTSVSPASQVMVTVLEEYREFWEPSLWFVRPEHRFVCEGRAESTLTASAAVLKIADASPSNVVIIAPARVHVLRESILAAALEDGCGWGGLRSARAVARTHDYLARLERIRSSRGCNAASASSSVFDSERFTLI